MAVRGEAEPVGHHREHMPCLDGLRGLAAVMVVLGHAGEFGFDPIVQTGCRDYGVLIFFALSGFLMGDLYLPGPFKPASVRAYFAARAARIVPIFYLVVLSSYVIFHVVDRTFVYDISNVQLVRLLTFNGSTSVFWSVAPEVQFYAVFGLFWYAYAKTANVAVWFAGVLLAAAVCLATISHWPGILVFSKLHIFACGMLCSVVRLRWPRAPSSATIMMAQGIALAVLILFMTSVGFSEWLGRTRFDQASDPAFAAFYGSAPRTLLAGFIVLSFAFAHPLGLAVFSNPLARLLGRCSFSIYLLHDAVFDIARKSKLLDGLDSRLGTLFVLAITILIATLTYRFIEAPSRRRLRQALLRVPLPWAGMPARSAA